MTPTVAYLISRHPHMGGEYYRAVRPAALLNRNFGWGSAVCNKMATQEENPGGPLSFVTPDNMVVTPDIIVVRPIREWRQHWTEQAQANGQLVVADLDDDVWAHDKYGELQDADPDFYEEWFWNVDAVLVSTRYLASRIKAMGHKSPVYVAPNCYDPWGLNAEPEPGHIIGTRLWLSGRMEGDLVMYDELVRPLLDELDLTFLHLGAADGHRFSDRGWDPSRLIELESVTIPMFADALKDLSIGMICMSEAPYNTGKTETHAAELASMGVPLVAASNHELYRNIPGRVETTPEAVRARVEALLNPIFWRMESANARAWARRLAIKNESLHMSAVTRMVEGLERASVVRVMSSIK